MIEASMMINDQMPSYCVYRAMNILNRDRKAINGAKILVLGIACKGNVDDCRESPALKVVGELVRCGAEVSYYDPFVNCYEDEAISLRSEAELTAELLEAADLVMITTGHSNVDYDLVQKHARMIFDTKNAMAKIADRSNIELL